MIRILLFILLFATPAFGQGRLNDPKYLVGYWPLTCNANDYSGNGNRGSWSGTESYRLGPFGKDMANFSSASITHASVATNTVSWWEGLNHVVMVGYSQYLNGKSTTGRTRYATATTIGSSFSGGIHDVRNYNVALTLPEIQSLYRLEQSVPKFTPIEYPIDTLPDRNDPTLVGAWLNYANPASANDYSSNARNGTPISVNWNKAGGSFNGTSSRISTGFANATTNLTVYAWINPTVSNSNVKIFLGSQSTDRLYMSYGANGRLEGGLGGLGATTVYGGVVGLSQWNLACMTYNGSVINLYLNGLLIYSSNYISTVNTVQTMQIGANNASGVVGNYFSGRIKDVRIYSESKSASWVAQEYQRSVPDDSIQLYLWNGKDYSKNQRAITNYKVQTGNGFMKFDKANSLLSASSDFIGTNDYTCTIWLKVSSLGEGNAGLILYNGKFQMFCKTPTKFSACNDGATEASSATGSLFFGRWICLTVTRSAGLVTFYIDGLLSGTANQSAGTLANGTASLTIGNRSALDYTFDGLLGPIIIRSRVMSADEIKAEYEGLKPYF